MPPSLSRYQVLGRLATGGMAEVWLARSVGIAGFEKLVVVKTILPHLARSQQFVTMFINEARLAAMINHPNCVQIFDLGEEGDTLYIAMEYLEGFSFSRVLSRARQNNVTLSEPVVARIIMDAASGLDHAHRLKDREGHPVGLVHRDVSPDNLLVGFSGQVKVVDFGIAKAVTPGIVAQTTSAGTVKGKHGYIAPEYLLGQPVDARADVFALGVVLYRALTGRRPFKGETETLVSMAVLEHEPTPPSELVPGLAVGLSDVTMMALAKDPAKRFESARAMRQAIEAAVRPAESEDVAEMMATLWGEGDPDRAVLHTLAQGEREELSNPAISAVSSTSRVMPDVAPAQAQTVSSPSFERVEPVFEEPPRKRRGWLVASALMALVAVAGLGIALKGRARPSLTKPGQAHVSVVVPLEVRVLVDEAESGAAPVELDLTPGDHVVRFVNKAKGIDVSQAVTVAAGQLVVISELPKARKK
jgi:serine/threonine-protein kinase